MKRQLTQSGKEVVLELGRSTAITSGSSVVLGLHLI
jgi:hypothetical protein